MKRNSSFRLCVLAALALCMGLASGCVGYRLGSTLPPGIESVYVPTFQNESGEPLLETQTTGAAIQELQKDGTLRVRDKSGADAMLEVTLISFTLEPLRYERDQSKTTNEYRMRIRAEILFTRLRDGSVLSKRTVEGEATFEPSGSLTTAKREALPEASRDLAHDIVENIVEYWY
jgi:hypothetical protein